MSLEGATNGTFSRFKAPYPGLIGRMVYACRYSRDRTLSLQKGHAHVRHDPGENSSSE